MKEHIFEIVLATYSIILPLVIGYGLKQIKRVRKERENARQVLTETKNYVQSSVDTLSEKFDDLKNDLAEERMMSSRYRIIRFSDEIFMGEAHSQDHFDQIFVDIDIYENYCRTHPKFINNKGKRAIKNIHDEYDRCVRTHSFLDNNIILVNQEDNCIEENMEKDCKVAN